MSEDRCKQWIKTIRELWPRYTTTDKELAEMWRTKRLGSWTNDEMAAALRHAKYQNWDAARPQWKAVFDHLQRRRTDNVDEWRQFLNSIRRSMAAAGDKRVNEYDDEYVWLHHIHSVIGMSLAEYHELMNLSVEELTERGITKHQRIQCFWAVRSLYVDWGEWFDRRGLPKPTWLIPPPFRDLPGMRKLDESGRQVELADDGVTWSPVEPFRPRATAQSLTASQAKLGDLIASAPDDAPATDTELAKTEDRPEEVGDSDLRRTARNGPRIDAMELE